MPQAIDEAGNIFEVDEAGNVLRHIGSTQQSGPQPITLGRPDPYRAEDRQMKRDAADRANRNSEQANMRAMAAQSLAERKFAYDQKKDGGNQKDPAQLAKLRAEAIHKIGLALDLADRSRNGWFTTGYGAGTVGAFSGTPAYDVARDTETLKNAGALQRIMEMAATNGGKNPLTPLSNFDFQALASSLTNLDPGQSDAQYQKNINTVIDMYRRAYDAAGGQDLTGEIAKATGKRREDVAIPGLQTPPTPPQGGNQSGFDATGGTPGGGGGSSGGDGGMTFADGFTVPNGAAMTAEQFMQLAKDHGPPKFDIGVSDESPPTPQEISARDNPLGAVDTAMRSVANMATLGQADKISAGLNSLINGNSYDTNLAGERQTNRADAIANPWAKMGGDIGGALLGTAGLAKVGGMTLGKLMPSMMQGGSKAQFGRGLLTDATYGGGLGASQGENPLTSAMLGAGGSALGQGGASAIGRIATPMMAPVAKRLSDAGVTLSLGQMLRDRGGLSGKIVGGIEDRAAGLSVVGDMIQGVRTRGVEDFNRIDMNNALSPIGGRVTESGHGGYAQADQAVSDAYNSSLGPMRLQADAPFNTALSGSPDYADSLVRPYMGQTGELSGEGLQAAKQALQAETAANQGVPGGFANRRILSQLQDELLGLAGRQAPDLAQGYRAADDAFAALAPIRKATAGAINKQGIYSPAQKGVALRATDTSSGKRMTALGMRPGQQFQSDAQQLLPSQVPDSGTAGRLLVSGIGLGAGGAGTLGMIDPSTAGTLMALSALYSKTGQKAAAKVLLGERPAAVKAIGSKIRKRKGLFGSAAVPLVIQGPAVN